MRLVAYWPSFANWPPQQNFGFLLWRPMRKDFERDSCSKLVEQDQTRFGCRRKWSWDDHQLRRGHAREKLEGVTGVRVVRELFPCRNQVWDKNEQETNTQLRNKNFAHLFAKCRHRVAFQQGEKNELFQKITSLLLTLDRQKSKCRSLRGFCNTWWQGVRFCWQL